MKPYAYYNEWDPYCAKWLRNLIADGHIAPGDVDERSIEDVYPSDLQGYTQCHFFAGIGGWSLALRLAGWPDDRPVWSGSAPCQPFSAAGKGAGTADERHLWPAFHHLIAQRRPSVVFGEQVEAAIRHGWRDLVQDDLEGVGYAYGDAGLPAACVGAPHIRQRLWFVAERLADGDARGCVGRGAERLFLQGIAERGATGGLAHPMHPGRAERRAESWGGQVAGCGEFGGVDNPTSPRHDGTEPGAEGEARDEARLCLSGEGCGHRGMADPNDTRLEGGDEGAVGRQRQAAERGGSAGDLDYLGRPSSPNGFWDDADWLFCRDGKWRPAQSGLEPLAARIPPGLGRMRAILQRMGFNPGCIKALLREPSSLIALAGKNRVGRLKGYGNAIVPQVAAEVIRAYMETRP